MLLERSDQLARLDALVDEAADDGGSVALIRGEAGIGKTHLVAEFVRRRADTAHILQGACDDLLTPQTFGALWDIAREEPDVADALATDNHRLVQEAMLQLLSRRLRPTVLVIEDTQWADEATLDVIKFLGRRIARTNALVVLTYRDTEVAVEHPLRQVIGDLTPASVVRIGLSPFSVGAVREMVGDRPLSVDAVMAQTDGNPLYVAEMVSWTDDDVPASIQEMVVARASKASTAARHMLDVVSVVPGEAEVDVIAGVIGPALPGLDECVRLGLLRANASAIGYVHEIQRRAIEAGLTPDRRRILNAAVMECLGPESDAARLVHHANEAGDAEAIIENAPRAARAAIAAESPRDALVHFSLLEPYLNLMNDEEAASVLYDWSEQAYHLHDSAALELIGRSVDRYRRIGDVVALGRALTLLSRVRMQRLQTLPALDAATEAVALLDDQTNSAVLSYALSALAHVTWLLEEDVPSSLKPAERALEVANDSGDKNAKIRALNIIGNMEYSVGLSGGMERLEQARALAEQVGDRSAETRALSNMAAMAADFRRMSLAIDLARRALETASRYEMRSNEAMASAIYAEILLWSGKWDLVEDAASAALGTTPEAETIAWRILGTLQMRRGRREAKTALERMWALARPAGQLTVVDPAAAVLAEYMWLSDDKDPAWLKALDAILDEGISVGNPWPSGPLALWMWKLGRMESKPPDTFDFYGWIIDGEPERAAAFWKEQGVPYEEALSLMHIGTDGRLEALRMAEEIGADALAARIRTELTADGHAPPRGKSHATREHAAGLTPRQAEVLAVLAEGLTNAEIADQFFLSPRTVENHVAAILMKLDVPTRAEAVAVARDRGLV